MPTKRRTSHPVKIGNVTIGGGTPIAIQSMTNTDTADVDATVKQIAELVDAGAELVRITVNNEAAAKAVPFIKKQLLKCSCVVPLIGDFHYNGHLLLAKFPGCAKALDKYRINPGTVGDTTKFDSMIACALKYDKPVRIGANLGSLNQIISIGKNPIEALVSSALSAAERAGKSGLPKNKIILSVKTSDVQDVIRAYRMLASSAAADDYALHLGLTEAGMGNKGLIASAAALAVLLQEGIGDTIRISITPDIGEPRAKEVEACKLLLQSMGIRQFRPLVTSCPGCGRTDNFDFQQLLKLVNDFIAKKMPQWKKNYHGVEKLKIAVMGCVVNGPGEARHADIGLSMPGKSEEPIAAVFVRGKLLKTLRGGDIGKDFLVILEQFVKEHYA